MRWLVLCIVSLYLTNAEEPDTSQVRPSSGFFGNQTDGAADAEGRNRQGKDFLDFLGLGTGENVDPYLAKSNGLCLNGDLSECFKSRALSSLDDFFTKDGYFVNENVRVIRMPVPQLRRLIDEPYEFSGVPRTDEPEWDQFVKFLLRKVEKFVKSAALEVKVPEEITEEGRYSPRFVDDIASELDIIFEDKKAGVFKRNKLKKLFIPLLIILKLFKLKLLLFLPMILGIASFKKLLGFFALVIPGLIGVYKFCKPQLQSSGFGGGHAQYYTQYSPAGVANHPEYSSSGGNHHPQYYSHDNFREDYLGYTGYNSNADVGKAIKPASSGTVAFKDDQKTDGSELAYSFHSQ